MIQKRPVIRFNVIFGPIELSSPYLWQKYGGAKPLRDEMNLTHESRSEAVTRALSDCGSEDSFDTPRSGLQTMTNIRCIPVRCHASPNRWLKTHSSMSSRPCLMPVKAPRMLQRLQRESSSPCWWSSMDVKFVQLSSLPVDRLKTGCLFAGPPHSSK